MISGIPEQLWPRLADRLGCAICGGGLTAEPEALTCVACLSRYPVDHGILDLRPADVAAKPEFRDWTEHWSKENQQTPAQRFFSFYRRAVFARTVAYFVNRYFPKAGVFLEAGSGTSETSERIDKHDGARLLVACDIILPILADCHPIMDVRAGADIFRLPFRDNALDGIWNVGVMEHFLHPDIDRIMRELHRVLQPGATLILLWPATDSLPQKGLRLVERVANTWRRGTPLRFHPDEISQLRSSDEGRDVLRRNGFETVTVDWGFRSLMAFKTVVGRKGPARIAPPVDTANGAMATRERGEREW
jgi:SAM-dependent methyltransferase